MARATKKRAEVRRVVLYARVSTAEQAERDLSLPAQLDAMRKWCADPARAYEIVTAYQEPGASGRDDDRKVFRRMLEDVLAPSAGIDAVLVYQTSRFMRNAGKARALKDALRKRGIRVIAICQEVTDDPMGSFIEGVFELVDQYESDINGMRTMAAMRENARQGYFNGSHAPYGFRAGQVDVAGRMKRKLEPEPSEAEGVREVLRAYVGAAGAKAAAEILNERGLRYRDGGSWSKDLVLKVVEETAAIGTYYWGKRDLKANILNAREDWIPIAVEPIVDRELWDMAQRVREQRDPKKNPGRTPSSPLLLAGLVRCGRAGCGARYQLETSGKASPGGTYDYRYYNCRNHLRVGKSRCAGQRLPAGAFERVVLDHVAERVFTMERCERMMRDLIEETGVLKAKTTEHRRQIESELEHVEKAMRRWVTAFERGDLDPEAGGERLTELKARRDELRQTLAKVVPLHVSPPRLTRGKIEHFQQSLRSGLLADDGALARHYLRTIVDEIVVTGTGTVSLVTRSDEVLRMLAAGGAATVGETALTSSPTVEVGWLPSGTRSGRIQTEVVIDLGAARKRLRPREYGPPPIQATLALAEDVRRRLEAPGVNQAAVARELGVTRARVTQVLNLLRLAPATLAFLRALPAGPEARRFTERRARTLLGLTPAKQLAALGASATAAAGGGRS